MLNSSTANQKFSGWSVVLGCFLLSFFAVAVISGTSALFMAPICQELGFDIASYSVINLISSLTNAVGAMVLAEKMQKGNMKNIMIGCAVLAAACFAVLGLCNQLWQFFVLFGLCNIGLSGIANLPVSLLVTAWFKDNRSIAMSVAFSGEGIGSAVWAIIFGKIMSAPGGWRTCYYIGGAVVLIISILSVIFFIKKDPASYGQEAYVNLNTKQKSEADNKPQDTWQGVEKKAAFKSMPFVMVVLIMLFLGCLAAGVATHVVNFLVSEGFEMTAASAVVSIFSLVSVFGIFVGGVIFEKLGLIGGVLFSTVSGIIGLIGLLLSSSNPMFVYLYSVGFALCMLMARLLPALLTSAVFGVKDYGAIYSFINLFFLVGAALGSVLTGVIGDIAGYRAAWILYAVFCALIFVCTVAAISGGKKLRAQYPYPTEADV